MGYTGYKITTYLDVNPQSPTFNTTREERTYDAQHCSGDSANWTVVTSYCELSGGSKTGYYITTEMDSNIDSPTYGQTRDTRTYNTTRCPLPSNNPEWVIDENTMYCEIKEFPSGLSGETGVLKFKMKDENPSSPTYNQIAESSMTESDWTSDYEQAYGEFPCEAVDTTPQVEAISESCVMVVCGSVSTTNGQKRVFGIDKNKYSDTYLESIETIVEDTDTCPDNCSGPTYVFTWDNDTTGRTENVTWSAITLSFGVISTKDGSSQNWSIQSGTATKTSTGITVDLSENTSTASSKTTSITLKQDESDKLIRLYVVQARKPNYVFKWSDSTSAKTVTVPYNTTSWRHGVTSTKNGENIGYIVIEPCAWLSSSITSSGVTLNFSRNTSTSARTCNVTLRQNESNKEITVSLTQEETSDIKVFATSNKYLLDGSSATTFTIHYWATVNDVITTNGVTLESYPLDEGESAFTYTEVSSGNDGKLYKTYRVSANNINHEKVAKFRAKYNNQYSNVITIKQSGVDQTVLPDFDFLTFTFNWTENDGRDLDTATFVLGSHLIVLNDVELDKLPVGFGCSGNNATFSAATKPYLEHGGDNTQSGNECALVNWKKICDHDYISEGINTLFCELYANWYNEYDQGNCSIAFKTYKGDGMQHGTDGNRYIFVPSGNTELVSEMTVSGHVQAFSSTNASQRKHSPTGDEKGFYSHVATLEYDIASKAALFTNRMTTPTGRNLRGYCTINGSVVTGGNTDTVGKTELTYDASSHSGSLNYGTFFNLINGTRYDASSYEYEIKYYSKDGHSLQTGYCTASMSNGVLSWSLNSNPTGERREADIILKGIEDNRNIIYRVECTQS